MQLASFQNRLQALKTAPRASGSKRGDIVKQFYEKMKNSHLDDQGNVKTYIKNGKEVKARPVTMKTLSIKLSKQMTGMSDSDLFSFYKECEYAKNFTIYFNWKFKKIK